MPTALEQITAQAMKLSPQQKFALAELLLESAQATPDPDAEAAWDSEIHERIRAIDEGRTVGVSHAVVMREAEKRLTR